MANYQKKALILKLCDEIAAYETPSGCACSMRAGETCAICLRSDENRKLEKNAKHLAKLVSKTENPSMVQSVYPKASYPQYSLEEVKADFKEMYELIDSKDLSIEKAARVVQLLIKHRETIAVRRHLTELVIKNVALEEEVKHLRKKLNWYKED